MKNPILKTGIVLGLVVEVWTFLFGFSGMFENPSTVWLFTPIAIVIQLLIFIWGLKQTAAQGRGYLGQVIAGVLIALVASIIIFFGSLLFTSVVFPDYLSQLQDMQADMLAQRGMSEDMIEQQLAMTGWMYSPFVQAIFGVIGTVVTGLILSLILAIFFRKKS